MLMSISFPAIIAEWVESVSLAASLRNDALSEKYVSSYSKNGSGCQAYFENNRPVLPSQVCQEQRFGSLIGNPLLDAMRSRLRWNWQDWHPWLAVDPLE